MALLDEIKKRLAAVKTPDITGTQKQMQNVLQAKTGKAGGTGAGPNISAVGEQGVQSELNQQGQQQQLQGALAGQQLQQQQDVQKQQQALGQEELATGRRMAESEMATQSTLAREGLAGQAERQRTQLDAQEQMKTNQMNSAFQQALAKLTAERNIQQDDLFANFRQSNKELEFREDAAEIQQRAMEMAMADQAYIDEIKAIGKIQGLEDDLTFKREYAKLVMGDNTDSMIKQLDWQTAFDADERTFNDKVGQMNIDQAIAVMDASIKDSNARAIGSGVIGGIQSANSSGAFQSDPAPTPAQSGGTSVG
jgi:hypothetical protein